MNGAVEVPLLNGEQAEEIRIVHDDGKPDYWLIVLDGGWFETTVARCDYAHHALGVAEALAAALDTQVVRPPHMDATLADERKGE